MVCTPVVSSTERADVLTPSRVSTTHSLANNLEKPIKALVRDFAVDEQDGALCDVAALVARSSMDLEVMGLLLLEEPLRL